MLINNDTYQRETLSERPIKVIHARPKPEIEVKMAFSLFEIIRKSAILSFKCFFPHLNPIMGYEMVFN